MGSARAPRGPGLTFSACLGQLRDNFTSWSQFGLDIWPYSPKIPSRFSLGFGRSTNPVLAGDSKRREWVRQGWVRWIVDYFNTGHGGCPSVGSKFLSKELRVLFSRAIFFSIFIEIYRSCKYTCSNSWYRSTFDTFLTKPRHKKGENTESLRFTIFWDIHSSNFFFQKAWVYLQFQNRWTKVSVVSSQKEQEATCFNLCLSCRENHLFLFVYAEI